MGNLSIAGEWQAVWSIIRKDFGVWLRQPSAIAATLLPAIGLIIALYFGAAAVGRNPVALVADGSGPHTQQLVRILKNDDAFIAHPMSATQASLALQHLDVDAVITIPSTFDAAYDAHQPDPVAIQINNLNLDFANDLRRSLPAAITQYYARQSASPVHIYVQEADLRARDIGLLQFDLVPDLVLLLTIAGVVNAGLATAREWEDQTVKELLLAPRSRATIIVGKLLAGWFTVLLVGAVVLAIGALTGYLRPNGIYWVPTLGAVLLIALASTGLGVALGALLRRFQPTAVVSILLSFYLFFLSGGIGVAAFLPQWVQSVAAFTPTFYGVHALQMAVFYDSTDQLGRDFTVLVLTALATVLLGAFTLRRRAYA